MPSVTVCGPLVDAGAVDGPGLMLPAPVFTACGPRVAFNAISIADTGNIRPCGEHASRICRTYRVSPRRVEPIFAIVISQKSAVMPLADPSAYFSSFFSAFLQSQTITKGVKRKVPGIGHLSYTRFQGRIILSKKFKLLAVVSRCGERRL